MTNFVTYNNRICYRITDTGKNIYLNYHITYGNRSYYQKDYKYKIDIKYRQLCHFGNKICYKKKKGHILDKMNN